MNKQAPRFNEALCQMAGVLNSDLAASEKLRLLVRTASSGLAVRGCSLMILDARKTKLFHLVSQGLSERYLTKGFLESQETLSDTLQGTIITILDVATDDRIQFREMAQQEHIVSILGVPVKLKGREVVGTLRAYSRTSREFTESEIGFLSTVADMAALVLESNRHIGSGRGPSGPTAQGVSPGVVLASHLQPATFAHPSEEELAKLLDFYQIDWLYEPRSFVLDCGEGKGTEMFTPDFYLPGLDLYIEMTTMKPGLSRHKKRRIRCIREQYPEVNIKLLARRDYDQLIAKYGHGPLSGAKTRGVGQVFFSTAQIHRRVRQLAKDISGDYEGKHPVLVGVLRGVFCFMADLMRALDIPADVDFIALSYFQDQEGKAVRVTEDLHVNIEGRHVLLVEDIVDTGMTLSFVLNYLRAYRPASLKVCTLLDKSVRRLADISLDYVGFEAPDEFLVGYGLDYDEEYRNLPFMALLEEQVAEAETTEE